MRLNVKDSQDQWKSATAITPTEDISFNNSRLTPIDILTVDKHSRLTLTKSVKKIIPLSPENRIAVYQDVYNKNLILKILQQGMVVDRWILTMGKRDNPKNSSNGNSAKKTYVATNTSLSNSNEKNNTLYTTPILLVDDEEDLLMTFNFFLKSEGYSNVKIFSSSKSMLKHLLESKNMLHYKLAIMDIRMPDINGIQLYQILRIINPSIKTMFLTALDAVDELTSIYPEIRPMDILRKPIESNQFVEAVNDKMSSLVTATY